MDAFGGRCVVDRGDRDARERLGELRLAIPGRHNLQNALAAVAVADRLGIDFAKVASALADFHGAERRFERHGEADGVLVVDDYGHHPTEIAAVLAAARATLGRRLIVAFQPHRYTRTQQLMDAFGPALREADEIVLTDIYAAERGADCRRHDRSARGRRAPRLGPAGARREAAGRRGSGAAADRAARRRGVDARRGIDRFDSAAVDSAARRAGARRNATRWRKVAAG